VTLTGGRNPFCPLLRYRTGDFAALEWHGGMPVLVGLDGRPPVWFVGGDGEKVHSMEVTRALRSFPLTQYRLHQRADRSFEFGYRGSPEVDEVREALHLALRKPAALELVEIGETNGGTQKVLAYSTDVPR
jgi:phenylacetate-CoA ligase